MVWVLVVLALVAVFGDRFDMATFFMVSAIFCEVTGLKREYNQKR